MQKYKCPQCHKPRERTSRPKKGSVCRPCAIKNSKGKRVEVRFRTCIKCGDKQEVNNKLQVSHQHCFSCYKDLHLETRTRTCEDCGDKKIMGCARDALAKKCKPCSIKASAKKRKTEQDNYVPKRYIHFCIDCDDIKITSHKRRRVKCAKCSRRKRPLEIIYFDFKDMKMKFKVPRIRHFRICPDCDDVKETNQSGAGLKRCKKCSMTHVVKTRKSRSSGIKYKKSDKPRKKSKSKKVSEQAIAKARQINKEHREAQLVVKKIPQKLSDREMQDIFLKKNKPSVVIPKNEEFPNIHGEAFIQSSYSGMVI